MVYNPKLWVFKLILVIWDSKTHNSFLFCIFSTFLCKFFCPWFGVVFFHFVLWAWIHAYFQISYILNDQQWIFEFYAIQNAFYFVHENSYGRCHGFKLSLSMPCKMVLVFFFYCVFLTVSKVLNLGHAWVSKCQKLVVKKKLITRKKVFPSIKAPPFFSFLFFLFFF